MTASSTATTSALRTLADAIDVRDALLRDLYAAAVRGEPYAPGALAQYHHAVERVRALESGRE